MLYRIMFLCGCLFVCPMLIGCGSSVDELGPAGEMPSEEIPADVQKEMDPEYMMKVMQDMKADQGGAAKEEGAEAAPEGDN